MPHQEFSSFPPILNGEMSDELREPTGLVVWGSGWINHGRGLKLCSFKQLRLADAMRTPDSPCCAGDSGKTTSDTKCKAFAN